ncbi:MAG: glycosyltransferase family 2 protein [Chloroflexota bacterium]
MTTGRRPSVSAVIIARDEERFIGECINSAGWADETLLVLDDATTDTTGEVAERLGARVVRAPWRGFPGQRNLGLWEAHGDWVLFVDADERVTPELAVEVRRTVFADAPEVGYWIPRRNLICGQWVRYAGWYPDRQLRLLKRSAARYDESVDVHEVATLDGPAGTLAEHLVHINYENLAEFRAKQRQYALLEARARYARGERARPRSLVIQPLKEFRRRYVTLEGRRQGMLGLRLSLEMALAAYWTARDMRRLQVGGVTART